MIDGATPFQILVRILLPVLKPALATVGLFCIVSHWNDWFSGMIYMNNPDNYHFRLTCNHCFRILSRFYSNKEQGIFRDFLCK